jgi:hypothetical protein
MCSKVWEAGSSSTVGTGAGVGGSGLRLVQSAPWRAAADVGGGWLTPAVGVPLAAVPGVEANERSCDIDVVEAIDADTFLFNYLALQRPVLVCGDPCSTRE